MYRCSTVNHTILLQLNHLTVMVSMMNVMYQNKNLHSMKGYELMVIITGTANTGWLSSTKF